MKIKSFVLTALMFYATTAVANSSNEQFLMLTDVHFDPFYACEINAQSSSCALATDLNKQPASAWASIFEKEGIKAPSKYGYDTNYALLKSTLAASKQLNDMANVGLVLTGGDFLAHGFQAKYQLYTGDQSESDYEAFVRKDFTFLRNEYLASFPDKTIIPVLGNNDAYAGDYAVTPKGSYFKDMADIFAPWIQNPQNKQTFENEFSGKESGFNGGYYAFKNNNIEIIVLDSTYFSYKRIEPKKANQDGLAVEELNWLGSTLSNAQKTNTPVWIVMHIPPGLNAYEAGTGATTGLRFWHKSANDQFLDIVKKYNNIKVIFTAHTHNDSLGEITGGRANIIEVLSPSISPVHNNNPAFKLYQADVNTGTLEDAITFYNSLTDPQNQFGFEYMFDEAYNRSADPDDPFDMTSDIDNLLRGKALFTSSAYENNYIKYYAAQSQTTSINTQNFKDYYCAATNMTVTHYQDCLGS